MNGASIAFHVSTQQRHRREREERHRQEEEERRQLEEQRKNNPPSYR
ncbi:MAG: hypothetical protein ACAH83_15525 [Alphaproteobacteria bacterium]